MGNAGLVLLLFVLVWTTFLKVQSSENVAERKPAKQSSVYDVLGHGPGKAVDGCTDQNLNKNPSCCSHQKEKEPSVWWRVNLTQIYNIESLKIFIRNDWDGSPWRLAGYRIYLSNTSNEADGQLCYDDTARTPQRPTPTSTVVKRTECSGLAQFVTIYNDRQSYSPPDIPDDYQTTAGDYTILELCEVQVMGCQLGHFGQDNCDQSCSGCVGSVCHPSTGKCEVCIKGKYGHRCQSDCQYPCKDGLCNKDDGKCEDCPANSFGEICIPCNKGCLGTCDSKNGECSPCKARVWGNMCQNNCSQGCGGNCDQTTGHCTNCKKGLFGEKCETPCPMNCRDKVCRKQDGQCNDCKKGLFGEKCETPCPMNCRDKVCRKQDGQCNDCKQGTYGNDCGTQCPTNCKDKMCHQQDGHCNGCQNGTYGEMCLSYCPVTCDIGICHQDSGKCSACIKGKYGFNCTSDCPDTCTICNQDTGTCKEKEQEKDQQSARDIGISVGVIFLVLTIIIVLVIRRKQRRNKREPNAPSVQFQNEDPRHGQPNAQLISNTHQPNGDREIEENVYYNTGPIGIAVKDLLSMVNGKMQNDGEALIKEFEALPSGSVHPHTIGSKAANKSRNRFKTTFPYDHSIVKLEKYPGDSSTDYINANYIDSVDERNAYVATQGPLESTVDDFWRMIWQLNTGKVVMLTNLKEGNKVKCEKYWPDKEKHLKTKHFELAVDVENHYAFYVLRVISVQHKKTNEHRRIVQFHFVTWPDHGTPDTTELILFHRRTKTYETGLSGPAVIHCSAGIGRTGTFIALDALLDYGRKTGRIDIRSYILNMRNNRTSMIQTQDQYIALHEALVEAFDAADTLIKKSEFCERFKQLNPDQKPANQALLRKEFMQLESLKPTYDSTSYFSCKEESNQKKNRSQSVLAADRFRVYLKVESSSDNDFINAVILRSHTAKTGYLITQFPLPDTVIDFWRMIKDFNSTMIVVLGSFQDVEPPSPWLPGDDGSLSVGGFTITVRNQSHDESTGIKTLEIGVTNKGVDYEDEIKVFQLTSWAQDIPVPRQNIFLNFVAAIENASGQGTNKPVVVMCRDGASKSGMYCLLATARQQIRMDDEVDIFQICRQIRTCRPECISNIEQYQFCFTGVQDLIENSSVYMNS